MDRGDFLLGVVTVAGTFLFTLVMDLLRGLIERRQRRNDQRSAFQRETLLELQEALDDYITASHVLHNDFYRLVAPTGEFVNVRFDRDNEIAQEAARTHLMKLRARVDDASVREGINLVQDAVVALFDAPTVDKARETARSLHRCQEDAQERIGKQLRTV